MSQNPVATRNQENARKSTGPKTGAGKARASQNARRHGATAQPDPETVKLWLKIILNRATITPADITPEDPLGRAALRLAVAEARRTAAEDATDAASTPTPEEGSDLAIFEDIYNHIEDLTYCLDLSPKDTREAHRRMRRTARWLAKFTRKDIARLELLMRYEREAQLERQRALMDWLELNRPAQT